MKNLLRRASASSGGVLCVLITVLSAPGSFAQDVTASINGSVLDPSGAAVADAKVVAKDLDRGSVWPTSTNAEGLYSLPRLPIGRYDLRVEKVGFQAAVRSDLALQLNDSVRLDFSLVVGQVTQTMDVTSAAPILQTESTQLGTVIDSRTNTQLPLATRNYVQLTLLTAGAVTPNPGGFKGSQTTFNSDRPYINGNREQTNNFMLDGMDNNQVSDNLVAYAPSVDAIQEFNEITQNPSAEFGNFMGGITSVSIKSGTNQYHGNAFEFIRNDKLNANDWASNWKNNPRSLLRWNEFGGTFGGPIIRNKLFFFADYQGSRFDTPSSTSSTSFLTALERGGNLSEILAVPGKNGALQTVHDPTTGVVYAGNIIPQGKLSHAALAIVNSQYYPQNPSGLSTTTNGLVNNQLNTSHSYTNGDQGDGKVDWNLSDNDHIFGRYSQSNYDNPTTNSLPLRYNSFGKYPIYNGALDYTKTISPTLVNDARIGVNYNTGNNGTSQSQLPNLPSQFGIPGVPVPLLPNMNITGGYASAIGTSGVYQLFADTVIQAEDTVIVTKGTHQIRAGFQAFRDRLDTFYSGNNGVAGSFTFNGQYSGLAEADFLLGLPSAVGVGTNGGTWGQRGNIFSAFAQDTWRINSNLTFNYGVRWELHTPWVEVDNRQTNFGLFTGQVNIANQTTAYGNNRALYNQYNGPFNFQPRVGFAWTPGGGHTVVRASYSLSSFLEGSGTNLRLTINPPFSTEKSVDYSSLAYPASTLDQGYGPVSSPANPYKGINVRLWDPNVRPAVSNQWNFTIQHQFGAVTTLQAGYVGQKNDHLIVAMPYHQGYLNPNGTVSPSPYLSGNPALAAIGQISGTATNGNQSYNSLQVTLKRNLADGLQGQFAYTYSKCLTDSIGFYGEGAQAANTSAYWQNLYNRKSEWGPCYYDLTHNVTLQATYDLPFGRKRAYGKNWNSAVDAVLGGWQVSPIVSFHNGFPLTITSNDHSGTSSRGARANCLAAPNIFGEQNSASGGYQWFDPSVYGAPATGTFGSCGVGTLRGPGLAEADVSVSKLFNVKERAKLEVRSDFINVSNTPILQAPNRGYGASGVNLGLLQSSQGARNIQFAMKVSF